MFDWLFFGKFPGWEVFRWEDIADMRNESYKQGYKDSEKAVSQYYENRSDMKSWSEFVKEIQCWRDDLINERD